MTIFIDLFLPYSRDVLDRQIEFFHLRSSLSILWVDSIQKNLNEFPWKDLNLKTIRKSF